MTEELKPCPFCNGEARIKTCDCDDVSFWQVTCGNPKCFCSSALFCSTREEAVAAWNNRPIEDALQKELDEAREDNADNMEYHVAALERLRTLLKSCCNEFVPLDKRTSPNYPVCYRNRLVIDKDRKCTARGDCPIYAELTKFYGSKDELDGRLVEFPNLKKAMERIGDGDGKFSFPLLIKKGDEK